MLKNCIDLNFVAISKCMPVIEIIKPTENSDIGDTNNDDDNNMENIYPSIEITATTENNDDISIKKLYPSIEITPMTENTVLGKFNFWTGFGNKTNSPADSGFLFLFYGFRILAIF